MGLNQYLDRMNTKTSFILILGCIDVCIGEANRKFLMENLHFHAKMNILAYDSTTSLWNPGLSNWNYLFFFICWP